MYDEDTMMVITPNTMGVAREIVPILEMSIMVIVDIIVDEQQLRLKTTVISFTTD